MSTLPLWFEYLLLVLAIILLALSIANAVYYGRAANDHNPNPPITKTNAHIMMWINILLALASLTVLILEILRLTIYREDAHIALYRKRNLDMKRIMSGENCDMYSTDQERRLCKMYNNFNNTRVREGLECNVIADLKGESSGAYTACRERQARNLQYSANPMMSVNSLDD